MSLIAELAALPGVIAAGEYSYRGDRFVCKGALDPELARRASIMCRATTMGVHMQADILAGFCRQGCGLVPARGWIVRGPRQTVCVVANVFCFLDNGTAPLDRVVRLMRERLADAPTELV